MGRDHWVGKETGDKRWLKRLEEESYENVRMSFKASVGCMPANVTCPLKCPIL